MVVSDTILKLKGVFDEKIIDIIVGNKIPFETYSHRTLDLVVMRICLLIDKNAK